MNKEKEIDFMLDFAKKLDADEEAARAQLVALFTAFCLHHDIDLDTPEFGAVVEDLFYALPEDVREHYEADSTEVVGNGPDAMENLYNELAEHLC